MIEWMRNIVGYMLIVSVVTQMTPNSKYEQYVRLFTGFLLIIFVLQPVLKIGSVDARLEQRISEFVMEQERLENQIAFQSEVFKQESEEVQRGDMDQITIEGIDQIQVEVTMDD